jgi:hypothetical protein
LPLAGAVSMMEAKVEVAGRDKREKLRGAMALGGGR